MSQRDEFLNRLQTSFECPESWDGMQGTESSRFCGQCQCEVVDFARLTASEVRMRLEASRGKMCARLTHEGGRLVLQRPAELPSPRRRRIPSKVSPIAATLLGAWLSVSPSGARPSPPSDASNTSSLDAKPGRDQEHRNQQDKASPNDAALRGILVGAEGKRLAGATVVVREVLGGRERTAVSDARGAFRFERLPAGVYDLRAELAGYQFEHAQDLLLEAGKERATSLKAQEAQGLSTLGLITAPEPHLRDRFDSSDLVVSAVVGESVVVSESRGLNEVQTRLRVVRRIKGEAAEGLITLRHFERSRSLDREFVDPNALKPGDEVVAFLRRAQTNEAGSKPVFERNGYRDGILRLEKAQREAYLEGTEALAKLENEGRNRGGLSLAELMDWMVETAENPFTRNETISEIKVAFDSLESLARKEGKESAVLAQNLVQIAERAGGRIVHPGQGVRPIFLGAAITEAHQKRLEAALWATEHLGQGDRNLFDLFYSWDRQVAVGWLKATLPTPEVPDGPFFWWLTNFAHKLESEKAHTFAASAKERWKTLETLQPRNASPLAGMEAEARSRALAHELVSELAGLLEE